MSRGLGDVYKRQIDACVNRDISRTERLAQALLKEMNKNGEYEVETLCLED